MYYSGDRGRSFDLYVNDEKFKTVTVDDAAGEGVFYLDTDEIPSHHLEIGEQTRYKTDSNGDFVLDEDGQKIPVVTVRFQSTGGFAGGVFGIYVTRGTTFDSNPDLAGLSFDTGTLSPAFSSGEKQYTLTVPTASTAVGMTATPNVPSGLVFVDGILFDDTQQRVVNLDEGDSTVVELQSYAQDHETSTAYTITIVKSDAQPDPDPDPESPTFVDVLPGQVFFEEIRWLADSGLSHGTDVGDRVFFYPASPMSRQAMAAFMYRYAGSDWVPVQGTRTFSDVGPDHPFYVQVEWMAELDLAAGYADGSFGATRPVSRQAMAAFLHRMAGEPTAVGGSSFTDVGAGHPFAGAIAWLEEAEIAEGYPDGSFGTVRPVTRQAIAAFLHRYNQLEVLR